MSIFKLLLVGALVTSTDGCANRGSKADPVEIDLETRFSHYIASTNHPLDDDTASRAFESALQLHTNGKVATAKPYQTLLENALSRLGRSGDFVPSNIIRLSEDGRFVTPHGEKCSLLFLATIRKEKEKELDVIFAPVTETPDEGLTAIHVILVRETDHWNISDCFFEVWHRY